MRYVADAHTLIWYLSDNPKLGSTATIVLDDPAIDIVIPATALAELMWIIERKPDKVGGLTHEVVRQALDLDPRISIYPLNRRVIERSISLTAVNEMHDRQIVATAAVIIDDGNDASLITCDLNITASGYVPITW